MVSMKQTTFITRLGLAAVAAVSLPVSAELTGNIGIGNETEAVRFDNPAQMDRGHQKWEVAGFFQNNSKSPGWFGGFYMMREDGFTGPWEDQTYTGGNSVGEIYLGKFVEASKGNWGAEVMVGHESAPDAYKVRPKVFGWYPLTDKLGLSGYAMYVMQNTRQEETDKPEQMMTELETEPKLEYRISDAFGVNVKAFLRDRHQEMPSDWHADRHEREYALKPGIYYNFSKLKTTLWAEYGDWKLTTPAETLKAFNYWRIGSTADYPLMDDLLFTSELGYQENFDPEGPWDMTSESYQVFVKLGVKYLF